MIEAIINILLLLILPFFFLGLINRVKSWWAGRQGPSILQPLYDCIKLMQKGAVISTATSFVFRIAPSITLASVITAGLLVPFASGKAVISFQADIILFAYLLGIGKFLAVTGAMDTGSSFEGMGASREASFSALVEPAFFLILGSLVLISGGLSFNQIIELAYNQEVAVLILPLAVMALFIMLLAEGCRVPVDDPNTHLELTMIHEVMVLDNSGPDMAFIMYAAAMKMVIIAALIANLIIPPGLTFLAALAGFIGVQALTAVLIGTIESLMARLRMTHVPQFLLFMASIAVIIMAAVLLFTPGGLK